MVHDPLLLMYAYKGEQMNVYENSKLNVKIFGRSDLSLTDYFASTQYFFSRDYLPESFSMLDIGGSSGQFIRALQSSGFKVSGGGY